MKLLKQRDHYKCGPIALYNAMVLLGVKPPSLKKLVKMCKTTSPRVSVEDKGTNFSDMAKAARKLGLTWKRVKHRSKRGIHIFNYKTPSGSKHIVASSKLGVHNVWRATHWNPGGGDYIATVLNLNHKRIKAFKLGVRNGNS